MPRAPIAFLAFAVLVSGCLEPRPEPPGARDPGANPLPEDDAPPADDAPPSGDDNETSDAMTLAVEPPTTVLTDVVTWRLVLTVRERTEIQHRGCPPELLDASVDRGDEPIGLYTYGEEPLFGACAIHAVTLEPGTYERNVSWNGRPRAEPPGPHTGDRLPPGSFPLVARLGATDRDVRATATVILAAQG
ncbi:MAG TPA: hypothetical protein VI997_09930 [Candidatus Thermoplasmatota archaeon]|nr:hypothetical protein [Candidatus Thermoplasmatota archaeon]